MKKINIRKEITAAAEQRFGREEKMPYKPWVTEGILKLMIERQTTKNKGNQEYRKLRNKIDRDVKQAKEEYIESKCKEIDEDINRDREYWYEAARVAIRRRLQDARGPLPRARNVILVVGDGMGLATVTASRILRGQRLGYQGEEYEMVWEKFPAVALARTYNADAQVGESSACATALLCGVKANLETVGLDARGRFEQCLSSFEARVPSLIGWAQEQGKATGIVTTTRITHATPAALYAHSASRYWEDDSKIPPSARKSCKDIARQLVEDDPGRSINVLLGGGRRHWLPKVARDPEPPAEEGRRLDGRNLIDDWIRDKKRRGLKAEYVWNQGQLASIDLQRVDHLLGLFSYSHLEFDADRDTSPEGDPSLTEMALTALRILQRKPKGFFLFVEGGRIDHAHHYNNAYRALDETLAMETAVMALLPLVNLNETLVVLTADHSHVLTMGGLATPKGNPILGIDGKVSDVDGLPYSTLLYGNGPGFISPRQIPNNLSSERNTAHGAAVPRQWATHGGEDVPVYAQGPLASLLFSGSFDQSYVPHAIAYIACLGEHAARCKRNSSQREHDECLIPQVRRVASRHDGVVSLASSIRSFNTATSCHHLSLSLLLFVVKCVTYYFAVT
ncbi:alkaline phosphatase, tissue-nonspecific isozyme [Anabrus simplex]|uniref:alkaline phosphatase, tissue-nonspecific isozyme n=1 Tax=Anabrus simplex TaxID=316456 RepID=UPI0035A348A7